MAAVVKTELPVCAVECHEDWIVAAEYLHSNAADRSGAVSIFSYAGNLISKVKTSPVFNVKIFNNSIAAATDSSLLLFSPTLEQIAAADNGCIHVSCPRCLSVDSAKNLVSSYSNGDVALFDGNLNLILKFAAHSLECWVSSFDFFSPNVIYSGADDALFKGWDARDSKNIFINKEHGAGVTCIKSSPLNDKYLVTGSYDEYVRLWDLRNMKNCLVKHRTLGCFLFTSGGGVWRVKWHPIDQNTLLTASMHAGFHVLKLSDFSSFTTDRVYFVGEHGSLAYGADWSPDGKYKATCSFYDCSIHIWE